MEMTMTAAKPVRLGLIGCGNISALHLRSIAAIPGVAVTALADLNEEHIAAVREDFPIAREAQAFADYRDLLATDVDGVVIMTPHGLHFQHIGDALRAGKHVLTEKPFVIHPEQARELIGLARERERILMVSYQFARMWPYRYARQQIASGALGEILFYSSQITQNWGRVGGWRRSPTLGEGGILVDTGSHFVDLMLFMTGMRPDTVAAFSQSDADLPRVDPAIGGEVTVDMVTGALVRFNGGRVATLGVVGRGPTLWQITIIGTKGTIEITDRDQLRHIGADNYDGWIGTERRNLAPPPEAREAVQTPDAEFIDAIRRADLTVSDVQRGLVVAQLTQAILASVREGGRPIDVGTLG
jgi:predicted dehydrogenase